MVYGIDKTIIRLPAFSGSFYPTNKQQLRSQLIKFFKNTQKVLIPDKIKALIVPHAGYIYSGQTAAWGYQQLPKNRKIINFILIGPSHNYYLSKLVISKYSIWQTPLGNIKHLTTVPLNKEITINNISHLNEHCLEVQLPFLQYIYNNKFTFSAFLIGSNFNLNNLVQYFIKYFNDSIFIISSDLSHYLPDKQAKKIDQETISAILKYDNNYLLKNSNVACGINAIQILLEIAKIKNWKIKLTSYDTSASFSHDINNVVGYASIAFYE